jgi:inositol phosphorylceramide mannosyltransferase catalytic subunit
MPPDSNDAEWFDIAPSVPGDAAARRAQKVPYDIYQTFKTGRVPATMYRAVRSWIEINPEYAYHFFDDAAMFDYAERGFPVDGFAFSRQTLIEALHTIKPGAGKADLFRYLIVYDRGGVYMDIDTVPLAPLSSFIRPADDTVSGIGEHGDLHQWGLIYAARHPFMKRAIENTVDNIVRRCFVDGYANTLVGLSGPACLDFSIKQVLNLPQFLQFRPGNYGYTCDGKDYRLRILPGNFFAGAVDFKYREYPADLARMNLPVWDNRDLFAAR